MIDKKFIRRHDLEVDPRFYRPQGAPISPHTTPLWRLAVEHWPISLGILAGLGTAALLIWAFVSLAGHRG